ncbi:MAG: translation initiation factor IF-2 [Bacteroidetes bacterium]|nr:translation initiation factor IF-2 [Bacteroidota bacterium]MBT3933813.1 translation initiation factor IF-2 [Bacteroidota bacterium]MBT4339791.1 translation initiation factor IF-2 [Bacteroidota bacterium]MBT5530593.1 translation initiation factor IF-2 [Cytophagia bacterium]MBT5992296.1 translation initiation factor IF-2 [Bacteroidota bacterium]
MSNSAPKRLSKVAKELNIATTTIIEFLGSKNVEVDSNPNTKISADVYDMLLEKFQSDKLSKEKTEEKIEVAKKEDSSRRAQYFPQQEEKEEILIKSNLIAQPEEVVEEKKVAPEPKKEIVEKPIEPEAEKVIEKPEIKVVEPVEEKLVEPIEEKPKKEEAELKVVGKIDLGKKDKPKKEELAKEIPKEIIKEEAPVEEKAEEPVIEKAEVVEEKAVEENIETVEAEEKKEEKEEKEEEKKEEKPEEPKEEPTPEPKEAEEKSEIEIKAEKADQPIVKEAETEIKKVVERDKPKEPGLTIVGKIDVDIINASKRRKPVASTTDPSSMRAKKRKRILKKEKPAGGKPDPVRVQKGKRPVAARKPEVDDKKIKEQVSATLAKLTGKQTAGGVTRSKLKKQKRRDQKERIQIEQDTVVEKVLEVIEFITVNELANLMSVGVTEVITSCMNMGMMVNINQRLDAETIMFVADEFDFDVTFKQESTDEPALEEEDNEEFVEERAPVVTIMGHVDHGKTTLLDHIRKSHITDKEAGGITQHIGAYEVRMKDGKKIVFLDTPGHEAFTSMRARGAKVTDIVIIVVSADDSVMPQTKEAISHAQAAGAPLVFAINKIDRDGANPDRIREQLSEMNILVEEWGGKYQSQEISAKNGINIDELLEKVLLEAEMLELKADPKKRAIGTVIEASLDKGKGIVATLLVQKGCLKVGDPILAGAFYAKVKALYDENRSRLDSVGPSTPIEVLGFDGSPTSGDIFYVTESEQQAKEIAAKRKRLIREQGIRATKHVTLDEIGRRIALGSFKELNIIIKGDVDGSVEALSDSMQKLSSEEVQVNVIHKGVGQISESDVMLASASDAVILGFQVRPSLTARKMAENEQIDIRHYSVIYDAIEELKSAIEGMLEPTQVEKIVCNVEVRDVFKITKVGTIAGSMVIDGKITRKTRVRVLREGVVVFTGDLSSLKRFKDDVKEVSSGYECGVGVYNFNDLKVGDIIEGFTTEQVSRKL